MKKSGGEGRERAAVSMVSVPLLINGKKYGRAGVSKYSDKRNPFGTGGGEILNVAK